jgi:hypothetical protein
MRNPEPLMRGRGQTPIDTWSIVVSRLRRDVSSAVMRGVSDAGRSIHAVAAASAMTIATLVAAIQRNSRRESSRRGGTFF